LADTRNKQITLYTFNILNFTIRNHRLRDSGSTVVTVATKVNEKTQIFTPCIGLSETPKNIETKIGTNDYVIHSSNSANKLSIYFLSLPFYARQHLLLRVYATAIPSVCLSHA